MEGSKCQFNCFPKTFKLIQANPQYQEHVANQLTEVKNELFEEIIFRETPSEQPSCPSVDEVEADQKRNEWFSAAIKLLISLVKEMRPQVGKTVKLKTKKRMWQVISEKMAENGHMYSAQQVEAKYYGLERQYKKNKVHNSRTGRNRQTCVFQDELDDLLQERKCINPEYVLDEESMVSTLDEEGPDDNVPSTSKESIGTRATPNKKRTLQEQFLQKMDTLAEQAKGFESKSLEILQDIAERGKRKEERAQKDEERKKRKLELLETLVAKIINK